MERNYVAGFGRIHNATSNGNTVYLNLIEQEGDTHPYLIEQEGDTNPYRSIAIGVIESRTSTGGARIRVTETVRSPFDQRRIVSALRHNLHVSSVFFNW